MKIGGFIKQSLMDYPGKMAAVIFTQGCNFRCGYCHNPQLVLPELFQSNPEFDADKILQYLAERKAWLDGVVVTGGEPTIHADLPDFLEEIKDMGYSIKLDTNGSNPYMLELIIKRKLADYIAMDVKTELSAIEYAKIIGISENDTIVENIIASMILLKQTSIKTEFRTTKIPGIHQSNVLETIASYFEDNNYNVNEFRDGNTIRQYLT